MFIQHTSLRMKGANPSLDMVSKYNSGCHRKEQRPEAPAGDEGAIAVTYPVTSLCNAEELLPLMVHTKLPSWRANDAN